MSLICPYHKYHVHIINVLVEIVQMHTKLPLPEYDPNRNVLVKTVQLHTELSLPEVSCTHKCPYLCCPYAHRTALTRSMMHPEISLLEFSNCTEICPYHTYNTHINVLIGIVQMHKKVRIPEYDAHRKVLVRIAQLHLELSLPEIPWYKLRLVYYRVLTLECPYRYIVLSKCTQNCPYEKYYAHRNVLVRIILLHTELSILDISYTHTYVNALLELSRFTQKILALTSMLHT